MDQSEATRTIQELSLGIVERRWKAIEVLNYFQQQARLAHEKTNCVMVFMDGYSEKAAEEIDANIKSGKEYDLKEYPLLDVEGYATVAAYQMNVGGIEKEDAGIVKLIKQLGGIPFCKTTICQFAITTESSSSLHGTTHNAYNPEYSAGGSSSGEGPLIALKGSLLGIGSDVGGSLRYPAAWNGLYCFKSTSNILPTNGTFKFEKGQTFIKVVSGPMASNMNDLKYVWDAFLTKDLQPFDPNCIPLAKKESYIKKKRFGYFTSCDSLPSTPAVQRAVNEAVQALQNQGYQAVEFKPTSMIDIYSLGSKILGANSSEESLNKVTSEGYHPTIQQLILFTKLPGFVKSSLAYVLNLLGEKLLWHGLNIQRKRSVGELWNIQHEIETYFTEFTKHYEELDIEFLISPVHGLPGHKHGSFMKTVPGTSYSLYFNLLNLPSGIIPVTNVDPKLDSFELNEWLNSKISNGLNLGRKGLSDLYGCYDATEMKGLPVGLQVSCKRYEDSKVLEAMQTVDDALKEYKKIN
ncbi:amidase signature enzyme [Neoconidiobolus thromboides FSU 785]|nr:amidase signature enzyme [Neoconidiobolus thromboides FSU 785]